MPRPLVRALFVFGAAICALLVGETALRVADYPYIGCPKVSQIPEDAIGRYDSVLGWSYIPGSTRTYNGVTYSFSREGYRAETVTQITDFSKPRILIVGDSTMFGDGVQFTDTFGYRLQKALHDRYEVVNFAVQGFGLDQIYLRLQQVMKTYKPRYVIVDFIEDQDYRDMNRDRRELFPCYVIAGTKPVFTLSGGRPVEIYKPELFTKYDNPRVLLVLKRFIDTLQQDSVDPKILSGALYAHLVDYIQKHGATFFGINYQLPLREYQKAQSASILVAQYGRSYVLPDGFHPNPQGTARLVNDFMKKFGEKLQ